MNWFNIIKDTKTATRSADLWVMNSEKDYFPIIQLIKLKVKSYLDWGWTKKEVIDDVLDAIAKELPEMMSQNKGFMEELLSPVNIDDEKGDGISDVDWLEVARNFEEDIEDTMSDYPEEELWQ
jgi:hypothetical protein